MLKATEGKLVAALGVETCYFWAQTSPTLHAPPIPSPTGTSELDAVCLSRMPTGISAEDPVTFLWPAAGWQLGL